LIVAIAAGRGLAAGIWSTALTDTQKSDITDEEWRARLTPEQYRVLRQHGTERAFSGPYLDSKEAGTFRCAGCGSPLFESGTKFESGTGWPSFTEAIPGSVKLIEDRSYGMVRTEVQCARCGGHLGHVFPDGPRDAGGLRYSMNGCALDLEKQTP
jgi:peptide-methionine (R)-S-oxide reductase